MNKPIKVKIKSTPPVAIEIRDELIRLDAFLKLAGAVETGGHAKQVIQAGKVRVNSEVCTERGKKLQVGDQARYAGQTYIVAEKTSQEPPCI